MSGRSIYAGLEHVAPRPVSLPNRWERQGVGTKLGTVAPASFRPPSLRCSASLLAALCGSDNPQPQPSAFGAYSGHFCAVAGILRVKRNGDDANLLRSRCCGRRTCVYPDPLNRGAMILSVSSTPHIHTPTMTEDEFCSWIRSRRSSETVAVLADRLGCASQAIWDWLAGRRRPSRQVRALAALLAHGARELDPGL